MILRKFLMATVIFTKTFCFSDWVLNTPLYQYVLSNLSNDFRVIFNVLFHVYSGMFRQYSQHFVCLACSELKYIQHPIKHLRTFCQNSQRLHLFLQNVICQMFDRVLITPLYLTFLTFLIFNILFQAYSYTIYAYFCLLRFTEVYSELWHIQAQSGKLRTQAYSGIFETYY